MEKREMTLEDACCRSSYWLPELIVLFALISNVIVAQHNENIQMQIDNNLNWQQSLI